MLANFIGLQVMSTRAPPPPPLPPSPPPGLGNFKEYVLGISWPVTYCLEKPCPTVRLPRQFTIHGLWPKGRKLVTSMEQFDPKNILSLRGRGLESWWINATLFPSPDSNELFWGYEWRKHGTASGLTQLDYFQTTLDLFKKFNTLYQTFEKSYSGGISINITEFADEFKSLAKPLVTCENGKLSELRFRVQKTVQLGFIPSTIPKAGVCGGQEMILLPY